jgi:hypothetical protein
MDLEGCYNIKTEKIQGMLTFMKDGSLTVSHKVMEEKRIKMVPFT